MLVSLRLGRTAPIFVLSFSLHSILLARSIFVGFLFLRLSFIVFLHTFLGLPRPRCPSTSSAVMLLIKPSLLATRPNQHNRLNCNNVCMLLIPRFSRRESELMRMSLRPTLHIQQTIALQYAPSPFLLQQVEARTKFSKREEGLDRTSVFRGGCWKREGDCFQGGECNF